jgi:hypothetical protein
MSVGRTGSGVTTFLWRLMEIKIKLVDNGCIVSTDESCCVFELKDESLKNENDVDCKFVQQVLYHIVELCGWMGSRYDKKRIHITTKRGDKDEGTPPWEEGHV